MFQTRLEMDDGFSMQRRRLGGVRQGLHEEYSGKSSIRGSQRDARPGMRGHHGANSGVARLRKMERESSPDSGRAGLHSRAAGAGRFVVWTLGRQLHLRDMAGFARIARAER